MEAALYASAIDGDTVRARPGVGDVDLDTIGQLALDELQRRFQEKGAKDLPGTGLMNLVNFWLKLKERETQKRTVEAEEAPDLFESLPSLPKARQKALLEEERARLAGRLGAVDAYLAEIAD